MDPILNDISSENDIIRMVDVFYGKVFSDDLLAPHFKHINFEEHKPRMIAFWSFALLSIPGYTTNVFDKHTALHINETHFNRWVKLFHETVDELFEGELATDAKFRATTLGWTFSEKMKKQNLSRQ